MSLIIGLTGGIGSGKTTVANLFAKKGIDVIDADIVAREVVEKGSDTLKEIAHKFGSSILLADGSLNRAKLRQQIFSQPEKKQWLNQLLHPKIRQNLLLQLGQARSPYCLLVAPLLIENNLHQLCQRILVVDVSTEIQIQRTVERDNVTQDLAREILVSQMNREQRLTFADDIVKNYDNKALLDVHVGKLHAKYLTLSNQSHDKYEH